MPIKGARQPYPESQPFSDTCTILQEDFASVLGTVELYNLKSTVILHSGDRFGIIVLSWFRVGSFSEIRVSYKHF